MKGNKTIKVEKILEHANDMLATENKGVITDDWINGGHESWKVDGEPDNNTPYLGNESRRVYY